ncbi:MAG: DUF1640 domain-containing protein [Alphaproteobacteria bacterium]
MTSIDTLEIANRLRNAGLDEKQAEAITGVLRDVHDADPSRLATKEDIAALRAELRSEVEILRRDLTIRLGGMIFVLGGFLAAIKFLGRADSRPIASTRTR